VPNSEKYPSSATRIAERFDLASLALERSWKRRKFGIAIAARIPMIATTIMSSMRVKPWRPLMFSGRFMRRFTPDGSLGPPQPLPADQSVERARGVPAGHGISRLRS
jgi:hypothetical protein